MASATPLAGKVALITGGTKGIGRATAELFSSQGATVAVSYGSDAASAEKVVSDLGGASKCLAIKADAGSVSSTETLVAEVVKAFGRIDILVPNAGILPMRDLASTTEADFDKAYAINVKGPYFLAQKAVPHMPAGGRIVFISTGQASASTVTPPYLLYCSTKGAVEQMTRIMAKELAGKGIGVNAIAPGPTGTDLFYEGKSEQVLKMISGFSPYNRIGKPEEIAQGIAFMAGPNSTWAAGQVLRLNGAGVV